MTKAQVKIEEMENKEKELRRVTAEYLQGKISLEEYCKKLPHLTTKIDLRKLAADIEKQRIKNQLHAVLDKGEKLLDWFAKKVKK